MPKKKRAIKGAFKCPKCDRKFSMKAHLVRHTSTMHASPAARAAKAAKRNAMAASRPMGRPKGVASKMGLRAMSLEQLQELIYAARAEANAKIAEFQQSFG